MRELILNFTKEEPTQRWQTLLDALKILNGLRQVVLVEPSHGLSECLQNAGSGQLITLSEGVYNGRFYISEDDIEIVGQGEKTIVMEHNGKHCLNVHGNDCIISGIVVASSYFGTGIFVVGSGNTVRNVKASGMGIICIQVMGNDNKLEQLTISCGQHGIGIRGCRNIVDQVNLHHIDLHANNYRGVGIPGFS